MPRRSRRPTESVGPSMLFSLEPLSNEEQELLKDAELAIRRRKLWLKIAPKESVSWAWSAFIESLAMVKASIDMGLVPCVQLDIGSSDYIRYRRIITDYQKACGAIPIDYTQVVDEIDRLHANGASLKELLFRLQGDAAKPRAHYAESWTVEASGLFDVKAART